MFNRSILIVIAVGMLACGSMAQICDSSSVTYLIRDSKGKPIDADKVVFEKETGSLGSTWEIGTRARTRYTGDKPRVEIPADIKEAIASAKTLETRKTCNFNNKQVRLALNLKKKQMILNFAFPMLGEFEARDFIVDSLPFKAGEYHITLETLTGKQVDYAAKGWHKKN